MYLAIICRIFYFVLDLTTNVCVANLSLNFTYIPRYLEHFITGEGVNIIALPPSFHWKEISTLALSNSNDVAIGQLSSTLEHGNFKFFFMQLIFFPTWYRVYYRDILFDIPDLVFSGPCFIKVCSSVLQGNCLLFVKIS